MDHLWSWFFDINKSRQTGHEGLPQAITCQEIQAWEELSGNKLTKQEFDIFRRMDETYCEELTAEIQYIRKIEAEKKGNK